MQAWSGTHGVDWEEYEGVEERGGIVFLNTDLHGLNGGLFAMVSQRSVGIRGIRVREEVNDVVDLETNLT